MTERPIAALLERLVALQEQAAIKARPLGEADVLTPRQATRALAGLGRDVGVEWLKLHGLVRVIPAAEMHARSTPHEIVIWGDVLAHVRRYPVALVVDAQAAEPATVTPPTDPRIALAAARLARARGGR